MAHPMSRNDVRIGLAVLAVVGLIGAGAFSLGGSETARSLGRGLSIAVVPPVEREVLPGETMEVGALSDGFDRAALDRPAEPSVYDGYLPPDAYVEAEAVARMPMPTPTPAGRDATLEAYRRVVDQSDSKRPASDPLADGSRAFGFDAPRPDYVGERALRWSRMETASSDQATLSPANAETGPVEYSSE